MVFAHPSQLSLRARAWGIALGTLIMIAVPAMLMSAKTVQISLPLLLVAALAAAWWRGRLGWEMRSRDPAVLALAAFISYATASGLWSAKPMASVLIGLMAGLIAAGSLLLARLLRDQHLDEALHIGEGLWIGLTAGLIYVVLEVASGQTIKIWAYNTLGLAPDMLEPARYYTWESGRVIAVHADDLKRNAFPIPLLLWPALMTGGAIASPARRALVRAALVVLTLAAVFGGTSQTCKVALLAGIAAFGLALVSIRLVRTSLAVVWVVACLGVIPIVLLLRHLELQEASWLPLSAQLRVTIWSEIAHLVSEAPILGVGADMTYFIRPPLHEVPAGTPEWLGRAIPHPHNLYLQTWYELGALGALLLASTGVLMLQRITRLEEAARPALFALFAATAAEVATSYNIWQIWFMCLLGFSTAMAALARHVISAVR